MKPRQPPVRDQRENHRRGTGGGNDGGGKPKSGASHHLGNRCAIPTFPPPDYCYIFLKTFARKEPSSPPAPSPSRLILRLEKTGI